MSSTFFFAVWESRPNFVPHEHCVGKQSPTLDKRRGGLGSFKGFLAKRCIMQLRLRAGRRSPPFQTPLGPFFFLRVVRGQPLFRLFWTGIFDAFL